MERARSWRPWLLPGLLLGLVVLVAALWRGRAGRPLVPAAATVAGGGAEAELRAFERTLREVELAEGRVSLAESPPPPVAERPAPSGEVSQDEEWGSFPITVFSFVRALLSSPASLQVHWLFRNRQLNPRDVYLSPDVRAALRAAFEPRRISVVRLSEEVNRVAGEELDQLIAARALRPVRYQDYVEQLDELARQEHDRLVGVAIEAVKRDGSFDGLGPEELEERIGEIQVLDPRRAHGFQPFLTRRVGNEHYACRLSDLASTCAAVGAYRAAFLGLVTDLTSTAREAQALDEAQQGALVDAAVHAFDGKYPR